MNRWRLLVGIIAVISGSILFWYMLHEREIAISIDEDWDALLMASGVVSAFFLALVLFILNNAEHLRKRSLRHAHEEANAEKTRFLRRLDHEMKNPLTAIQAAIANLENQSNEKDLQTILSIRNQTERLNHLVRDLRVIGNLDKQDFQPQIIRVRELFEELKIIVQEEYSSRGQTLEISCPDNLPIIDGDYDLLLTAFYNLLNNAIKYTTEAGKILVAAQYDSKAKAVLFRVEDNGQGIPAYDLPYVWDELFRSETVREIVGSGIGLALVRSIVDKHHGKIWISSEVNKGTKVFMQIPIQHVSEL